MDHEPKGIEPVTGWRAWSLLGLGRTREATDAASIESFRTAPQQLPTQLSWMLGSVYGNARPSDAWPAVETMVASCFACNNPPTLNCWAGTCGIYIGHSSSIGPLLLPLREQPPDLLAAAFGPTEEPRRLVPEDKTWNRPSVIGLATGCGRVVQDEAGWHAEYARPRTVAITCTDCLVLDQRLTRAHGVDAIEVLEGWQAVAYCRAHISERIRRGFPSHVVPANLVEVDLLERYGVQRADFSEVELLVS